MLVAMMAPMTIMPVRHALARSLRARGFRTVALVLVAYTVVWVVACVGLVALSGAAHAAMTLPVLAVFAVGVAVAWQCSPLKQSCLNRTHRHRDIHAFGRAADIDAARLGAEHGIWCVGSCWALMLMALLVDASVLWMAAISLWLWAEQLEKARRPTWAVRVPYKATRLVAAQVRRYFTLTGAPRASHA
jgi:predicted metal-binding membrane protein